MKKVKIAAILACLLTSTGICPADLILSGGFPPNTFPKAVRRYSDSGVFLGQIATSSDESIDGLAVDPAGNLYGVGNTLGGGTIYQFSGAGAGNTYVSQYVVAALDGFEFAWNGHLFVSSAQSTLLFPSSITGVLELNATTRSFIRNAIPFPGSSPGFQIGIIPQKLAFDPEFVNSPNFLQGVLYVGSVDADTNVTTISRYRQTVFGTITKDTAFSIVGSGEVEIRHLDDSLLIANGSSINRFTSANGAPLGIFLSIPTGQIRDFSIANDNSIFVLNNSGSLYHFDANGTFLSTILSTPNVGVERFVYLPVPEPVTAALMTPFALLLLSRRAKR